MVSPATGGGAGGEGRLEGGSSVGHREHRETTALKDVQWIKKWGWQMFTPCMGTGAVAVCLHSVPYDFNGQHAIGTIFFILDLILFLLNVGMTTARIIKYPKVFKHSFYDQGEGIWVPTSLLALATLQIGLILYGIPYVKATWLVTAAEVVYWIYAILGWVAAVTMQKRLLPRPLKVAGPSEALEVFPLMLCGTIGSLLVPHLVELGRTNNAITVLVFSYCMQGLGFWMGLLKMSVWMVHHILLARVPASTLPSYIISVGPPGFTAFALINLGIATLTLFPLIGFLSGSPIPIDPTLAAQVFFLVSVWWALLMVGMCTWIILIHVGWSVLSGVQMIRYGFTDRYDMSWWSWTFPLSGLISTLGKFAILFPSKAFGVLNIVGTCFVICMWVLNILGTSRLLMRGILPGAPVEYDPSEIEQEIEGGGGDTTLLEEIMPRIRSRIISNRTG